MGIGGEEAIGKKLAACQICEGSGGHRGFGWDVSQLHFTQISHQHGKSKKSSKTCRMQNRPGKSYDMSHLSNALYHGEGCVKWVFERINEFLHSWITMSKS